MTRRKQAQGQTVRFPEGSVTIVRSDAPTIVLVEQTLLKHRADPGFWNPKWAEYQEYQPDRLKKLGDYIIHLTYGPIVTGKRPRSLGSWDRGVLVVGQRELTDEFLDISNADIVEEGSEWDSPRARLAYRDILFPRSGVGSLGKHRFGVWLQNDPNRKAVVSCFVDLVRLDLAKVFPEYVVVYLKSRLGRMQIDRLISGVGTINIDFDEIKSLLFHEISLERQEQVALEYRRIAKLHEDAIQLRKLGDLGRSNYYFGVARGMLTTLITQVERLIEGKQERILPLIPEDSPDKLRAVLELEYQRLGDYNGEKAFHEEEPTTQQANCIRLIQLLEGLQETM